MKTRENEINYIGGVPNFGKLNVDAKPYKIVSNHSSVIPEFKEAYLKLYNYYINKVDVHSKDTIKASVFGGVVDMDREPVKTLESVGVTYLRELKKTNNNFVKVAVVTKRNHKFLASTSYKRVLSVVKKEIMNDLMDDGVIDKVYFDNWFRKFSVAGYLGKMVKHNARLVPEEAPIEVNYGYYSLLLAKLMTLKKSRTGMLVVEILTGRRISECNIDHFEWIDTNNEVSRELIQKTYSIDDKHLDVVLNNHSWVLFSGQKKVKNVEKRKELIDNGVLHTDTVYPIPLLLKVTKEEFYYWGNLVKEAVIACNVEKDIESDYWDSHIGGVRRLRGYTETYHKAFIPDLSKAHNIRAVYGSIMSQRLSGLCNVPDTLTTMSALLGHVDLTSTARYRVIRVVNNDLSSKSKDMITNLEQILHDFESCKSKGGGAKRQYENDEFVNWKRAERVHYKKYLNSPNDFDRMKVITSGSVDFSTFSRLSGDEYKRAMDDIFVKLEEDCGFSYRVLVNRYDKLSFPIVLQLAIRVHLPTLNLSAVTKKKNMDQIYAKYISDLDTIEEETEIVIEPDYHNKEE